MGGRLGVEQPRRARHTVGQGRQPERAGLALRALSIDDRFAVEALAQTASEAVQPIDVERRGSLDEPLARGMQGRRGDRAARIAEPCANGIERRGAQASRCGGAGGSSAGSGSRPGSALPAASSTPALTAVAASRRDSPVVTRTSSSAVRWPSRCARPSCASSGRERRASSPAMSAVRASSSRRAFAPRSVSESSSASPRSRNAAGLSGSRSSTARTVARCSRGGGAGIPRWFHRTYVRTRAMAQSWEKSCAEGGVEEARAAPPRAPRPSARASILRPRRPYAGCPPRGSRPRRP